MKLLLVFLFTAVVLAAGAFAQDAAAAGVPGSELGLLGLSTTTQLHIMMAGIAFKYLSEFYASVRNGGGLRRIILSFWFGEAVPKVIADDYKKELSNPPFPKP